MMFSKTINKTRAALYRLLSRIYRSEVDAPLLDALKGMTFPTDAPQPQLAEGYARLRTWLEGCGERALDDLAADYAAVFLAAGSADGSAAIPCESVYTSPRKIYMQEAWESVTALYRAHALGKAEGLDDLMEDHLALELAFMAHLIGENDTKHQQAFLEGHLLNWVPDFVADIDRYARQDFYKAVGLITLGFLKLDLALLSGLNNPENHALQKAPSFSVRADRMENIFARMKERYRLLAPTDGIPPRYGEINVLTDIALKEPASLQPLELRPLLASSDRDVLLFLPPAHLAEARAWADELEHRVRFLLLEPAGGSRCSWEKAKDCSAAVHIDDICALVEVRDEALLPYFQDEVPIN